jgi:type II secretory pathway pseudopilin PulG
MKLSALSSLFFVRCTRRQRTGLTLMELVVVMVILVALAGILLPLFPSMLTRAHTSSTATNATEVSKAVQLYYNMYSGYPYNLDNLTTSPGTIASYVAAGQSTDLFAYTLQQADVNALNSAAANYPGGTPGIMYVLPIVESSNGTAGGIWSPTFNPYSTATPMSATQLAASATSISTSTSVVAVTQQAVTRELGVIANGTSTTNPATYVMFGLGDYSGMAGKTLEEAPVHFDDSSTGQPNLIYGRFGLVFQTQDGSGTQLVAAKFIGTVDLADADGITTASDHIQTYYQLK